MTDPFSHPQPSRRALAGLAGLAGAALAAPTLAQPLTRGGIGAARDLVQGDWFAQVRAQHQAVDRMFAAVRAARGANQRLGLFRDLKLALTAHSVAEEVSLYPGLALSGQRQAADRAYQEQSEAKILLAELDSLDPVGRQFEDRLNTLMTAIRSHVEAEERDWYPQLQRRAGAMNDKMTRDFRQSFRRYLEA